MICEDCKEDNLTPCCKNNQCEASIGDKTITSCIHCYAELIEVNGFWYHHTQFENEKLISDNIQDVVR